VSEYGTTTTKTTIHNIIHQYHPPLTRHAKGSRNDLPRIGMQGSRDDTFGLPEGMIRYLCGIRVTVIVIVTVTVILQQRFCLLNLFLVVQQQSWITGQQHLRKASPVRRRIESFPFGIEFGYRLCRHLFDGHGRQRHRYDTGTGGCQ